MNTADKLITSVIYTAQQVGSVGSAPIFTFPGIQYIPGFLGVKTGEIKAEKPVFPKDKDILELAKKYYMDHKESFLKKYRGKYIAIINSKVIGSDREFSKLAKRVYEKYGYQTIYMPFVDVKEKVIRMPSPRINSL